MNTICNRFSEGSLSLDAYLGFSPLIYRSDAHAFMLKREGHRLLRLLLSEARQSNITIHACYVRFTAKAPLFSDKRRIDLCWHIPLPLRLLLRAMYQPDGVYIDFHRT